MRKGRADKCKGTSSCYPRNDEELEVGEAVDDVAGDEAGWCWGVLMGTVRGILSEWQVGSQLRRWLGSVLEWVREIMSAAVGSSLAPNKRSAWRMGDASHDVRPLS